MKHLLTLCIIILAGILGYLAEPSLRPLITGEEADTEAPIRIPSGDDEVTLVAAPKIDPTKLTPDQLPKTITLKETIQFTDKDSGLTITMRSGSVAKLLSIDGLRAQISPGDTSYRILVPINKTDLHDQLAANPPAPPSGTVATVVAPPAEPVAPAPVAPAAAAEPATTPQAAPAPTPEPQPAPAPTAEPQPNPTPTAEPQPAPAPEPAPAVTSTSPQNLSSSDVVAIMKNSILDKQIKEFGFEQVTEWKKGDPATHNGESFSTGIAIYKEESLFGVRMIEAQAFIKGGKVTRWIWPKSGIELK